MPKIDFSNTIDTDDIDEALDNLKGVSVLLRGLLYLHGEGGSQTYQKEAYTALENLCNTVIGDFEGMKPKIEYMQSEIRGVKL